MNNSNNLDCKGMRMWPYPKKNCMFFWGGEKKVALSCGLFLNMFWSYCNCLLNFVGYLFKITAVEYGNREKTMKLANTLWTCELHGTSIECSELTFNILGGCFNDISLGYGNTFNLLQKVTLDVDIS